jgi:dTMP kinase
MRKFITFEGVEGCGKSTQIKLIADALRIEGRDVLATEEPGGSDIGKELRRLLLNRSQIKISSEAELLLFMADRAQHVREMILPALDENRIVLCDRFSDATIAYQGFGRGMDLKDIENLNRFACADLKPDLTFLFDISVEEGIARAMKRMANAELSKREDRFESEEINFHERVRKGYLKLAQNEAARFRIVDGSKGIEEVHAAVWAEINKII